ncbi:MAG: hypothetical protein IPM91_13275 [Bacteroidetes bacterium]|nr:hypothetical protein [Bacteroidota bacterium]
MFEVQKAEDYSGSDILQDVYPVNEKYNLSLSATGVFNTIEMDSGLTVLCANFLLCFYQCTTLNR